jgi:hypothetical protein
VDEVDEEAAEGLLGGLEAAVRAAERRRHARRSRRLGVLARQGGCGRGAQIPLRAGRVEGGPGLIRVGAQRRRQLDHLVAGQER